MLRILITRAPHQASPLTDALRAAGLEPILIPTIQIVPPTTFAQLDAAIANLDHFHWLIFTSANAVEALAERVANIVILSEAKDMLLRSGTKIAAIGPATARALEAVGLTPDLIPPQAVAESLAATLLSQAKPGIRFLLIRAEQARDHLPETLRGTGAEVTIAPAYRTVIPTASAQRIRELFHSPATYPDAIAFTSSSTVTNLMALLKAADLSLPPGVRRISIGPITSQTLRDFGLPPYAEAAEPTVSALAEMLIQSTAS